MTAIVAIVAIVEKTNTNPGDNNCRNYGLMTAIVEVLVNALPSKTTLSLNRTS